MRIGLQTWGTEGDIRPFFALAGALSARGHEVRLVTTNVEGRSLSALGQGAHVDEERVGAEYFREARARIADGARENFRVKNPVKQLERILVDALDPVAHAMFDAGRDLAEWADALVVHSMAHPAVSAAEATAKPFACVAFAPLFPTRDYPPMGAPRLGRLFHPLLWWVAAKAMDGVLGARVAVVRERAGLPPVKNVSTAVTERACAGLLAMSPALLPRPADFDEKIAVTGFWELREGDATSTLDERLAAFLGAGDAPLFFTLGSMANLEPARALEAAHAAIRAARALGMRAVVQLPEAEHTKLPPADDVFVTVRAPHAEVFSRCAVVVHHGGAGTTHAALRAGRPEVVVPHIADQFFWADLLYRRGVAPKPLPARALDESGLTARVRAARRLEVQERAERLAREVERELGVESACAHVERVFSRERARG